MTEKQNYKQTSTTPIRIKTKVVAVKRVLVLLLLMVAESVFKPAGAQSYPQGYFRSPMDIPLFLSGSFGELRANHFHTGLDIKTQGVEGQRIYATAEGYVSRIRVSHYGYGLVLYMNHPNGYTTVYAHLSRFHSSIEKYIREKQYELKKEEVDLDSLPSNLFVFKKGEVIAWSGNSGSSGGPHLHFEIRETATEKALNPMLFGFDIKDDIKPTIHDIKIYPLTDTTVIEGQGSERMIKATGANGKYTLAKEVRARGAIGFAVHTIDMTTGSGNLCGVYEVELYLKDSLLWKQQMQCIDFRTNRYINTHMDYLEHREKKNSYHKSYIKGNNALDIYPVKVNNGWVTIQPGQRLPMKYLVKDIKGNVSELKFTIVSDSTKIKAEKTDPCPKSAMQDYGLFPVHWDHPNIIKFMDMEVLIPATGIYDNHCILVERHARRKDALAHTFRVGNSDIPVQEFMEVSIPCDTLPENLRPYAIGIFINAKGKISSEGGTYENGHVTFRTRSFGRYTVMLDTIPPVLTPVNISEGKNVSTHKELQFTVSDNLSGVKAYEAFINGEWILLRYKVKTSKLILNMEEEKIPTGTHTLEVRVRDERGNESVYRCSFTR